MGLRKEAETWLAAIWLRGYMAIKVAPVLEVWMPLEYCDAIFSLNICGLLIVFNFKAVLFQKLKGTQLPSIWFLWKKKTKQNKQKQKQKKKAGTFFAAQESSMVPPRGAKGDIYLRKKNWREPRCPADDFSEKKKRKKKGLDFLPTRNKSSGGFHGTSQRGKGWHSSSERFSLRNVRGICAISLCHLL